MKKLMHIAVLLFCISIFGKTKCTIAVDTIWYDCDYNVTIKAKAEIYKVRPYIIQNKYIHVYYYKSTNKSHLISYSLDLEDSKLDGKRTYYFENGNVNYIIHYKNNLKEGPFIEYYDDAKVYQQGEFKKDKKNGTFVLKKKDGSLLGKEYWCNGIKVEKLPKAKTNLSKAVVNRE